MSELKSSGCPASALRLRVFLRLRFLLTSWLPGAFVSCSCSAAACSQTDNLPHTWYDTPNIHFCTIKDFRDLCTAVGVKMERALALNAWGRPLRLHAPWWFWNLFGEQAVFLLSRR